MTPTSNHNRWMLVLVFGITGLVLFTLLVLPTDRSTPGGRRVDVDGQSGATPPDLDSPPDTVRSPPIVNVDRRAGSTLLGTVTDDMGVPLSQAIIEFAELPAESPGAKSSLHQSRLAGKGQLHCDSSGTFQTNIAPGLYQLVVSANGFVPTYISIVAVGAGDARDLGAIRLRAACRISGFVITYDGLPVIGASIRWQQRGEPPATFDSRPVAATTDALGRFEFTGPPAGCWDLLATASGLPRGHLEACSEGVTSPDITIRMPRPSLVSGRLIHLEAWQPPLSPIVRMDIRLPAGGAEGRPSTTTMLEPNVRGEFFATSVPQPEGPGRCGLQAVIPASDTLYWPISDHSEFGVLDSTIEVGLDQPAGMRCQPRDSMGRPLDNCTLSLETLGGTVPLTGTPYLEHSASDGSYRISRLPSHHRIGPVRLRIALDGFETWRTQELSLGPGQSLDLGTITINAAPCTQVMVTDALSGVPIEGAIVISVGAAQGSADQMHRGLRSEVRTDTLGRASICAPPDLVLHITVQADGYAPATPVSVQGQANIRLALERGGVLQVRVVDTNGEESPSRVVVLRRGKNPKSAQALISPFVSIEEHAVSDSHGSVTFSALEEGDVEVRLQLHSILPEARAENATATVNINSGITSHATLVMPKEHAVIGQVIADGVPLSAADIYLFSREPSTSGLPSSAVSGQEYSLARRRPCAVTSTRGTFELGYLVEGNYIVHIEHRSLSLPFTDDIEIDAQHKALVFDFTTCNVQAVMERTDASSPVALAFALYSVNARSRVEYALRTGGTALAQLVSLGLVAIAMPAPGLSADFSGVPAGPHWMLSAYAGTSELGTPKDVNCGTAMPVKFAPSTAPGGTITVRITGSFTSGRVFLRGTSPFGPTLDKLVAAEGTTRIDGVVSGAWSLFLVTGLEESVVPGSQRDISVISGQDTFVEFSIR